MSYLNWHVGMKVVCVDTSRFGPDCPLRKGSIYTVAHIQYSTPRDVVMIDVSEVKNPDDEWAVQFGHPPGFGAHRFSPVQERKTDISIFTAMLDKERHPENIEGA